MAEAMIRVNAVVRDQLREVAAAREMTLGALLADIAQHLADEQLLIRAERALARLEQDDPDGFADYRAELKAWDDGTAAGAGGLGDARTEWPEYNTAAYRATIGTRR